MLQTRGSIWASTAGSTNGLSTEEPSLKTPFVIRYPGVVKPGTKANEVVSNIDWAPTILNITGTPVPSELQGESFLPLLAGQKTNWRHVLSATSSSRTMCPRTSACVPRSTLWRGSMAPNELELYDIQKDPQ